MTRYLDYKQASEIFGTTSAELDRLIAAGLIHAEENGQYSEDEIKEYISLRKKQIDETLRFVCPKKNLTQLELETLIFPYVIDNAMIGLPAFDLTVLINPNDGMTYEEHYQGFLSAWHPGPDPVDKYFDDNYKSMDLWSPDVVSATFDPQSDGTYRFISAWKWRITSGPDAV